MQILLTLKRVYLLRAEKLRFPYKKPSIEIMLAERLSDFNNQSFEENLKSLRGIFIKVATSHLESYNIKSPSNLEKIRKMFEESSQFYNINYLISFIRKGSY